MRYEKPSRDGIQKTRQWKQCIYLVPPNLSLIQCMESLIISKALMTCRWSSRRAINRHSTRRHGRGWLRERNFILWGVCKFAILHHSWLQTLHGVLKRSRGIHVHSLGGIKQVVWGALLIVQRRVRVGGIVVIEGSKRGLGGERMKGLKHIRCVQLQGGRGGYRWLWLHLNHIIYLQGVWGYTGQRGGAGFVSLFASLFVRWGLSRWTLCGMRIPMRHVMCPPSLLLLTIYYHSYLSFPSFPSPFLPLRLTSP